LPPEVIIQVTGMMKAERQNLTSSIQAYEAARDTGDATILQLRSGSDPGVTLIVARIAKVIRRRTWRGDLGLRSSRFSDMRRIDMAQ
jgi:HTH-type transcriptional regulator/antitoxin HigA